MKYSIELSIKIMNKIFFLLVAISCLPVVAQQDSKEAKRICRALFPNKPGDAPNTVFLFDGKTSHKIYLSGKAFSSPVELPPGAITVFFSLSEILLPEELKPGLPSMTIPARVTDLYLLASSDPGNKLLPLRFNPINVNDERLKPGEILWLNLSKHNVNAKLGNHQFIIPPMKQAISPPPREGDGYYPAKFIYQQNGAGKFHKALNKTWRFQENSKSLGFIIDSGGRRPEIFTIRDRRTTPTPSTAE